MCEYCYRKQLTDDLGEQNRLAVLDPQNNIDESKAKLFWGPIYDDLINSPQERIDRVKLIKYLYSFESAGAGGYAHIVTDDSNLETEDIEWCIHIVKILLTLL
jgi:hypothetical protein